MPRKPASCLISPTLVIGACAGAALGELAALVIPAGASSSPALYAIIGMVAMMGATLVSGDNREGAQICPTRR